MKQIARLLAISLAASSFVLASADLKIGDTAPPIKVAKWIKGKPANLKSGRVNVVEFWATWCGPCKASIPHLTELAKKYKGKVDFTGVSVWEERNLKQNTHLKKVSDFVTEWGAKMDYNVAADGFEGTMAKTWMEAAGQGGIPTAFVIGKDGKVLWIGHPMGELEEVLDQVLAGTYDAKAAADKLAQQAEMERKQRAMFEPINKAVAAKDFATAVSEIDKLIAANPQMELGMSTMKFTYMLQADEKGAYAYALKMAEGPAKDIPGLLNAYAWPIVDDKSKLKTPDYAIAEKIAARAVEASKGEDGFILDTYAYALFKNGKLDKAIEVQEKAVAAAAKMGDAIPAETVKEIKDRLAMFKAKKG